MSISSLNRSLSTPSFKGEEKRVSKENHLLRNTGIAAATGAGVATVKDIPLVNSTLKKINPFTRLANFAQTKSPQKLKDLAGTISSKAGSMKKTCADLATKALPVVKKAGKAGAYTAGAFVAGTVAKVVYDVKTAEK